MEGVVRFGARALLAAIFARSGYRLLVDPSRQVEQAKKQLPALPEPEALARAHGAAQVAGAAWLVLGPGKRGAALLLALLLLPATYIGHPFWQQTEPRARNQQLIHLLKNLAILGGLLSIAAQDRAGSNRSHQLEHPV